MSDKEDRTVVADFEILMDYYKAYADYVTPQPIINDVEVVFKGKHNALALGKVSLKFVYVTENTIELRVLTQLRDTFTILIFKGDTETKLYITYENDINY